MKPTITEVRVAREEGEVRRCWSAYKELRPHLRSEDELVERWRVQAREGFQIVYIPEGDIVPAAAGYRYLNTLAWGHILYVDDLVVIATRQKKGLGTLLLQHLKDEAGRQGCNLQFTSTPATSVTSRIWHTCEMDFVSTVTTSHVKSGEIVNEPDRQEVMFRSR